ncbi:MAG: hypothetical protein NWF04_07605 [Candidatus Bathyarchaeota archaeon]|nr:hypothetical protein [Candidatus Bathyarchaeota archaeon]
MKITTRQIAMVTVFASLYAVLRVIPTVPMIGVEGASFSVADVLAPIYGIILGPYVGGLSVIVGTFIGMSVKTPFFLGLDFLPALVNTVALGFLVRRKWWPVVLLNVALFLGFVLNPLTLNFVEIPTGSASIAVPFMWMHIVAFIVLLSPLGRNAGKWIQSQKPQKAIAGFAVLAFIGTMMQHLMGNILYENIFVYVSKFLTPESIMVRWNAVFFLYPIERTILVIFATIIGVVLIRVLQKSFHNILNLPPPENQQK